MKIMRVSLLGMLAISSASLMGNPPQVRPTASTASRSAAPVTKAPLSYGQRLAAITGYSSAGGESGWNFTEAANATGTAISSAPKAAFSAIRRTAKPTATAEATLVSVEAVPMVEATPLNKGTLTIGEATAAVAKHINQKSNNPFDVTDSNFTSNEKPTTLATSIPAAQPSFGQRFQASLSSRNSRGLSDLAVKTDAAESNSSDNNQSSQSNEPAPQTMYQRAYSAAKTVYNTPGALVEAMGGNGDFITGKTNSLASAASAVYNAPGQAVAYATGNKDNAKFMSNARQSIRTSAKNANNPLNGPLQVGQSRRSLSNLPVRTLDSVLQAAQDLPNNATNRLVAAKNTVVSWFSGKKDLTADNLTPAEKTEVNTLVENESNKPGATPQSTTTGIWNYLTSKFGSRKTQALDQSETLNPLQQNALTNSSFNNNNINASSFTQNSNTTGFSNFDEPTNFADFNSTEAQNAFKQRISPVTNSAKPFDPFNRNDKPLEDLSAEPKSTIRTPLLNGFSNSSAARPAQVRAPINSQKQETTDLFAEWDKSDNSNKQIDTPQAPATIVGYKNSPNATAIRRAQQLAKKDPAAIERTALQNKVKETLSQHSDANSTADFFNNNGNSTATTETPKPTKEQALNRIQKTFAARKIQKTFRENRDNLLSKFYIENEQIFPTDELNNMINDIQDDIDHKNTGRTVSEQDRLQMIPYLPKLKAELARRKAASSPTGVAQ